MKTIGDYTLQTIETGRFRLDGGAMFGTVPKVLWDQQLPSDPQNRIDMALRTLLIRGHGRTILIDTGMGHKWDERQQSMYALDYSHTTLTQSLNAAGIGLSDITDVILTHLHFDHAGGATMLRDGEPAPAFPNATYYIQKSNLEWARNAHERERASYLPQNFEPLALAGCLESIDGPTTLFPGLSVFVSDGHTIGLQGVRIEGSGESVVYCSDLIPTSAHIPVPWIMGYDIQPLILLNEKKNLLSQALDQNWILFFEHDPVTEACRLKPGKKYVEKGDPVVFS
ncbi:MAG: MBL fold metallo-hydrolase [Bacteroidetes bacterium]|nr:MBL fold metallo-hydrolase [Bacteroidota bacterium]